MLDVVVNKIVNMGAGFWLTIAAILVLLVFSAFFSGSETALTAASRGKLRRQADQGSRPAARALGLTQDSERLIGAVLLGNNLTNILAAALATSLFTQLFGDSGVAVATLVMTLLVLVFAEVMPKTYAIANPESASKRVSGVIAPFIIVAAPVVTAIRWFVRSVLRLFGALPDEGSSEADTQDEIAGTIALGHTEGVMEKGDRDRLLGALDLKDREVEEIMLHRSSIEMIDAEAKPEDILAQCLASSHTRLPVFLKDPENIVGVVHARDLLRSVDKLTREDPNGINKFKVLDVAMEPYFVPETTMLDDQMHEFLRRKAHFALIVDEYGALQGLVTLEDILEEIVGEITDEHDIEAPQVTAKTSDGDVVVEGSTTIRDLNRAHDWNLPDDEAVTVAGLIMHEARIIPVVGQVFSFHGFRFEVAERKENRITLLKLRPL